MNNTLTIQPGQPGEGMNYNVQKPLPYPFHVDANTGDVTPGPQTNNESWRLLGFQVRADIQQVALWRDDWLNDPQRAVGMVPVFVDSKGNLFNLDVPITKVVDYRTSVNVHTLENH